MDLISSYYNEYFYNTCFADPWINVAKELLSKHKINPVYLIGYDYDNSEELVKHFFQG